MTYYERILGISLTSYYPHLVSLNGPNKADYLSVIDVQLTGTKHLPLISYTLTVSSVKNDLTFSLPFFILRNLPRTFPNQIILFTHSACFTFLLHNILQNMAHSIVAL